MDRPELTVSRSNVVESRLSSPEVTELAASLYHVVLRENPSVPNKFRLTLDIDEVATTTRLVVPPYAGMKADDVIAVLLEGVGVEGSVFKDSKKITKDDVGSPVLFEVLKSFFECPNLLGYYFNVSFTVTSAEERPEPEPSLVQTVLVVKSPWADPKLPRLKPLRLIDPTISVLYPPEHPEGVDIWGDRYTGIQSTDFLYIFDSAGQLVDCKWGTTEEGGDLAFRLSAAWLSSRANAGATRLYMQYVGVNRGNVSWPALLTVREMREFNELPLVASSIGFFNARVGLTIGIPSSADVKHGALALYIRNEKALPDDYPIMESFNYQVINGNVSFWFAPETLDKLLGLELETYYELVSQHGVRIRSGSAKFAISMPGASERHFPMLQCLQVQGRTTLSLARVTGEGATLRLGAWSLMSVGQIFEVNLTRSKGGEVLEKIALPSVTVTDSHMEEKFVDMLLSKEYLTAGEEVMLEPYLRFNVTDKKPGGEGQALLSSVIIPVVE